MHPYNFQDIKRKYETPIYQKFADKLMILKDHKVIYDKKEQDKQYIKTV